MSDEHKDPPIKEQGFLGGVNVINFGDIRVARGLSERPFTGCKHRSLIYDSRERRVWCEDCENNIESFDAFLSLVENFHTAHLKYERIRSEAIEARDHNLISIAAKVIDEAWRKKKLVPCCPHCSTALFPEDFKNGINRFQGKSYALEMARKKRDKETQS